LKLSLYKSQTTPAANDVLLPTSHKLSATAYRSTGVYQIQQSNERS